MTTLARLHGKGALTREQSGRAYTYALPGGPAAARASITAHQMRRLLDAGGDRADILARFVSDLSADDERLLAELLAGEQDAGEQAG
ncbi:MAG TPA: BlaI/MecI/CopY family transcriptional regulator [Streptosporangiaceae bacterium]